MEKVVIYTRVSTQRQGRSGLGLEAQERTIAEYVERTGSKVVGSFKEVQSGKSADNRPQLQEALALCRLTGAKLLAAKLDRIGRSASFLLSLRDSGVDFIIADMPSANRFTVGIMACLAEYERQLISERTKAALKSAKDRGVVLGNPNGAAAFGDKRGQGAQEARTAKADDYAQKVAKHLLPLRAEGLPMAKIADRLNDMGIPTPRGGAAGWKASTVKRALDRLEAVA